MVQVLDTTQTLEEFLASTAAEEEPVWEYLPGGRLVRKVSPSVEHSIVQGYLVWLFLDYVQAHHLAMDVLPEGRAVLPTSSPVPDVSVYRGRFALDAQGQLPKYAAGPPCLAVEILSPGQTRRQLLERCRLFVQAGTDLALLVDAHARTVTAVTATGEQTLRDEQLVPLTVVPELAGLRLSAADVFTRLPQHS